MKKMVSVQEVDRMPTQTLSRGYTTRDLNHILSEIKQTERERIRKRLEDERMVANLLGKPVDKTILQYVRERL